MASSVEDLVNKLRLYDYIRCTFTDMNGVARGRVLPTSTAAGFLTKGIGVYAGEIHLNSLITGNFTNHGQPVPRPDPT